MKPGEITYFHPEQSKGKRILNEKLLMVDCDDTAVLWDTSSYSDLETVDVLCYGRISVLKKHQKNINLVIKFAKLGYGIIMWSQTGAEWAEAVGIAIGLDHYVLQYLTKPRYYLDDMDCTHWMGTRIWRNPRKNQATLEASTTEYPSKTLSEK